MPLVRKTLKCPDCGTDILLASRGRIRYVQGLPNGKLLTFFQLSVYQCWCHRCQKSFYESFPFLSSPKARITKALKQLILKLRAEDVLVAASGATNIETWTSPDGFRSVPSLAAYAEKPLLSAPPPGTSKRDWNVLRAKNQPRALWNGMVYPLVPFTFRGALWYQGESNRTQGLAYKEYLVALWNGWSKAFENPELPFYLVQIAPYDYDMKPDNPKATDCGIWEAEAAFARENPHAGMASIVDVGEHDNIHPGDKRTVAIRLAALALNRTYGRKDVPCDGPEVVSAAVKGDVVTLKFNHVRKWLMHGTDPAPFELAGADGKFVPATVKYLDGAVELRARGAVDPKQVRYLWNWCGKGRLKNDYGFPLAPFHMRSLVPAAPAGRGEM